MQWKIFTQKTYNYVNLHEYEMISRKHQILHLLRMFIASPQVFAHTFSCFANSSSACASFSLSIKRRADVMLVCLLLSETYSVSYCFRNLRHLSLHRQWLRPSPFLSDWFHGLTNLLTFYSPQRLDLFAWCVRLSRLLVGFRTHFKSSHVLLLLLCMMRHITEKQNKAHYSCNNLPS